LKFLSRVALLTVLVDGIGAFLTFYWAKFVPYECHNFTCQTPPFWLEWAMFISFGLGVILPIIGIGSTVSRRYFSRAKSGSVSSATSLSSIPQPPNYFSNERGSENLRMVFEIIAFCFLLVTAIGLFILHSAYMGFYYTCYLPGFVPPGFNCSNIFADGFFADWSIITVLSSVGAALSGTLSGPLVDRLLRSRKPSHQQTLHAERMSP